MGIGSHRVMGIGLPLLNVADALAARVAGAAVMQRALRQVTALAPVHHAYVTHEVLPVLRSGFLPPVALGFDLFRASASTRQVTDRIVDETLTSGVTGEFDTHPTLREAWRRSTN